MSRSTPSYTPLRVFPMSDIQQAGLKARLNHADTILNGTMAMRLQRERAALADEENAYKRKLEAVSGFRKLDIIPIGKLHRSLDESESESEAPSETEVTASPEQTTAGPRLLPVTTTDRQSRLDWAQDESQDLSGASGGVSGVDLDADLEDLDNQVPDEDHSQQILHHQDMSEELMEGDGSASYTI